jgi:hypothetical protein
MKDIKCPVCFEDDGVMLILTCDHTIHPECAKGLISKTCPYCRIDLKDLPDNIDKKINKNVDKRKKEVEQIDLENALNNHNSDRLADIILNYLDEIDFPEMILNSLSEDDRYIDMDESYSVYSGGFFAIATIEEDYLDWSE